MTRKHSTRRQRPGLTFRMISCGAAGMLSASFQQPAPLHDMLTTHAFPTADPPAIHSRQPDNSLPVATDGLSSSTLTLSVHLLSRLAALLALLAYFPLGTSAGGYFWAGKHCTHLAAAGSMRTLRVLLQLQQAWFSANNLILHMTCSPLTPG